MSSCHPPPHTHTQTYTHSFFKFYTSIHWDILWRWSNSSFFITQLVCPKPRGKVEDFYWKVRIFAFSSVWLHPCMTTPKLRVMKFRQTILSSSILYYIYLVCLIYATVEKKILKEIEHFHNIKHVYKVTLIKKWHFLQSVSDFLSIYGHALAKEPIP